MSTTTPDRVGAGAVLDAINRRAWREPDTVRMYERLEGWTDPGEQAAVERVTPEARSRPILDIGVGAGRTTGILREISLDYVGVDYTREMVDACRTRHPQARIEHMDARDLGAFADNQFALVMFSFNGIDAVDLVDRRKVLREVHRVLQPGGVFLVSAHNRNGPGVSKQKPRMALEFSWNPVRLGWRLLKMLRSWMQARANHRVYRELNEAHEDWAILNCAAHDFGIVIVYTTIGEQKRLLDAAGFKTEIILGSADGRPVTGDDDTTNAWFHYIARKA